MILYSKPFHNQPENVLKSQDGQWKLCDFGSCSNTRYDCSQERERARAEDDIQRNTTLQYRSPEMVDLYRKQLISEKADIWALGTLLYTLTFFEAPFNDSSLGILNCSYYWPEKFSYSNKLAELIKKLLRPNPSERPDILTLLNWVERILGIPEKQREQKFPSLPSTTSQTVSEAQPKSAQNLFELLDWEDDKMQSQTSHHSQNQNGSKNTHSTQGSSSASESFDPFGNANMPTKSPQAAAPNAKPSQSQNLLDLLDWQDPKVQPQTSHSSNQSDYGLRNLNLSSTPFDPFGNNATQSQSNLQPQKNLGGSGWHQPSYYTPQPPRPTPHPSYHTPQPSHQTSLPRNAQNSSQLAKNNDIWNFDFAK